MIRVTLELRALIVGTMASVLLFFSTISVFTILAIGIGTIVTVLCMMYGYRPGALMGIMILAGISAAALPIDTILAANVLMTVVLGRFVPLLVVAILGLSAYDVDEGITRATVRPFATTVLLGSVCIVAVPIIGLVIGLINPAFSTGLNSMNQIGIVILISIVAAIVTTRGAIESGARRVLPPVEKAER